MSGFFTFKWSHPAGEVYVTGTFDNWEKSTKLEKEGDAFVARVELPIEKTLYKFVVDGNWVVDQSAPRESNDGIENNLLIPEDIVAEAPETDMSATLISSAAPDATTASLAADVPIEHATDLSDVPDGFPETPAAEITGPTPITEDGQVFSAKPLPASDIPTNPFHLEPGEPVPQNEFTTADINKHVKLDEESYLRADASNLGSGLNEVPVLSEVITPVAVREEEGRGVLDTPVTTTNMTPESSLPITSFAAAAIVLETPEIVEPKEEAIVESNTIVVTTVGGIMAAAGIASASGEPNNETTPAVVPEIVRDSQKEARAEPEASAVEQVVEAKREFEAELKEEVHQLAPVHHAVAEPAVKVPVVVQESLAESGASSEAAGVSEAVELKKEVEAAVTEPVAPTPLLKDEPKEEAETLVVPSKTENGTALNGNATSAKSEKSEKEIEANGNGTKSPKKKSLENGDAGELKKSKRKSFFGSILDKVFHSGTGTKDKGKAKGEISP